MVYFADMSVGARFLLAWMALVTGPAAAAAGEAAHEEPCDPEQVGVADMAAIDSFAAAIRDAVASGDVDRFAALVWLPLKVNARDPEYGQIRTLRIRDERELRQQKGRSTQGAPAALIHDEEGVALWRWRSGAVYPNVPPFEASPNQITNGEVPG